MSPGRLRILVADEDSAALADLERVLTALGHDVIPHAVTVAEAARLIGQEDPDVAVVMVHEDVDHALALIAEAVESASGPVLAQLRPSAAEAEAVERAAELGITAWVPSLEPHTVQAALEVALRRHEQTAALAEQVGHLETALERRTLIERAKGIVMERYSVDEAEAFRMLRDRARSQSRRVVDLARDVADGKPLLAGD